MNKEQEKVWKRLTYVKPELPPTAILMAGRAMGKSVLAMQAFGRAMRELKNE